MADDSAADGLQSNLLQLAPKLVKVAEKRKFKSEEAKSILNLLNISELEDGDIEHNAG
jgi:hypothetical protein